MKNNILSISEYRNNPEFYFSKGLRLANKKNLSEAYRNLTKALELEPDNSEYKFNMACFLSELQRPGEANRLFNDILINFDPTMFDCFFGLGCNSFEVGNNEKAAEYFDKYLYFDAEGEFSYEISEMAFYLKLYSEVSHNNRFLKTSASNLKKAQKQLEENSYEKAVGYLYKAIQANPFNVEARNQLTLALMEKRQFIRAEYMNSTVNIIDSENIWGNCLNIYLLSRSKKNAAFRRALELLPYRPMENRDELLCAATVLMVFDKTEELVKLVETYAVEYSDRLIYSVLMLAYIITGRRSKALELSELINICTENCGSLADWVSYIIDENNRGQIADNVIKEYINLFCVNQEPMKPRYDAGKYYGLLMDNEFGKVKLPRKYAPIIEGALKNREIVYSSLYKKEITGIFTKAVQGLKQSIEPFGGSYDMYSAALEYSYCRLFHIEMEKGEIINKYKITSGLLNDALKVLNISF